MPPPVLMTDAVRQQGAERPDAVACLFAGRNITYGEIDRRGSQVANGLIAAGCGPGARVAVLSKNSDSFLEILAGSMTAGTVLLPLNWRLAAPEIAYILQHGCTQSSEEHTSELQSLMRIP